MTRQERIYLCILISFCLFLMAVTPIVCITLFANLSFNDAVGYVFIFCTLSAFIGIFFGWKMYRIDQQCPESIAKDAIKEADKLAASIAYRNLVHQKMQAHMAKISWCVLCGAESMPHLDSCPNKDVSKSN